MAVKITYVQTVDLLGGVADAMIASKDELTTLDAALGDGDLGRTVDRGFTAIKTTLASADEFDSDLGKLLFKAGKTFADAAASSFGALLGTAFMKGGMALKGSAEADGLAIVTALQTALDALMERGKAKLGDKTMLDALYPAIEAMRTQLSADDLTLTALLRAGADAAEAGAQQTQNMQSQIGRASWQGERSVGHIDPGARAVALMLDAAARHSQTFDAA
ncbi:MAG: dihydroxyacetone kinase subunit L [Chloroflexi bacterium]|nr:dihydroxyacetone kinase subunit L [Chloroflexota bacterium]